MLALLVMCGILTGAGCGVLSKTKTVQGLVGGVVLVLIGTCWFGTIII